MLLFVYDFSAIITPYVERVTISPVKSITKGQNSEKLLSRKVVGTSPFYLSPVSSLIQWTLVLKQLKARIDTVLYLKTLKL